MRYFWFIALFVMIAQDSWAFVVSDTLIIDSEIVYIEEEQKPVTDSLDQARKKDFKEKRKPLVWGIDGGYGLQITDFSISNYVNQNLVNVNEFLNVSNNTFYHSGFGLGSYFRVHRNIEIGLAFQGSTGSVSESSATLNNATGDEGITISFYTSENKIYQVFETEVQPSVFELDTALISTNSQNFNLKSFQIPLKFRFYVNEFTLKSKWRAFGEISPVYRYFKMSSYTTNDGQMLFLNANGNYEFLNLENRSWHSYGVLVGVGSEFFISKKLNAFAQANWSFPPVNNLGNSGASYYTQYSNLFLGVRLLIGDGK